LSRAVVTTHSRLFVYTEWQAENLREMDSVPRPRDLWTASRSRIQDCPHMQMSMALVFINETR
jgi:hypothetical protein